MGDVLGGDFVLRGPNPFKKKKCSSCHAYAYHMVESRSLNGPLKMLTISLQKQCTMNMTPPRMTFVTAKSA